MHERVDVFFRKLRTTLTSSTNKMRFWRLLLIYLEKFKANIEVLDLCSPRIKYPDFFRKVVNDA